MSEHLLSLKIWQVLNWERTVLPSARNILLPLLRHILHSVFVADTGKFLLISILPSVCIYRQRRLRSWDRSSWIVEEVCLYECKCNAFPVGNYGFLLAIMMDIFKKQKHMWITRCFESQKLDLYFKWNKNSKEGTKFYFEVLEMLWSSNFRKIKFRKFPKKKN